jgi:sec-independent protein translocase protein TatA
MDGIFSGWHWIIVVIAFVALFGAAKLPIFARSLGQSMRIFKSEVRGLKEDDAAATGTTPTPQPAIPSYVQQPVTPPGVGQPTPTAQPAATPAPAQIFTDANGQQYVMQPVTPQSQPEQH